MSAMAINVDTIPAELKDGKRFVGFRFEGRGDSKPSKCPYSPESAPKRASHSDPSHWMTFDQALRYAQVAALDGVMRAFAPEDKMVGFDFDGVRDPETGVIDPPVARIIKRIDSYTEVSPSGTGLKVWAKGSIPRSRHVGNAEVYDQQRFFALTGLHLEGTPREVKYRPDAISAIYRELFPEPEVSSGPVVERDGPIPALEMGDEEVLRLASESPHNGERFRRLWDGDSSDYAAAGNDGESEADGALCEILAYYGGPDEERIARLFERSGRMRPKWERPDYRERTIALALRGKTRFYGDGIRPPASGSDGAVGCACDCCDHAGGPELTRLRRLLLEREDLIESQQAIVRTQRAELESKTAYLSHVTNVLAKPNGEMKATQKVIALALANEAHYRADRGRSRLPLAALCERTGFSKNTVSRESQALAEREGSPFERTVTRELRHNDDGSEQWISTIDFHLRTERTADTLVAIAQLPPAPDQPKHGGSAAAAAAREEVRHCRKHPGAEPVASTLWRCPVCRTILGETDALNHQLGDSEPCPPSVDVPLLSTHQVGDPAAMNGHAAALDYQVGISAPPNGHAHPIGADTTNGHAPAAAAIATAPPLKPKREPWRCPGVKVNGTRCGALERRRRPEGDFACLGCGWPAPPPDYGAAP